MAGLESTRGERNIKWIESNILTPDGRNIGKPMLMRDWQQDIIKRIYDTPTRRAIISFGRKNGKTALSAALCLLHLCGPMARRNSQLFSAAQSREQAAILFDLAQKMVRMSPRLSKFIQIRDTAKELLCPELGTKYRALSADAPTAYGLSPVFAVHDELGQVRGPRSSLYEAIETASAAHDDPLSIIISTQAATDADLLSVLVDDAKTGADPKTKLFLYTAGEELDAFSDGALKAANPAFGDFQAPEELRDMAAGAKRMPALEASYRNLFLNQRIESISPFITREVWNSNAGKLSPDFSQYPVFGGLDLSQTSDLTSLELVANIDGNWHVKSYFWLPDDGLHDRARRDRTPYDVWKTEGHLSTTPGKAIEYRYVARVLFDLFQKFDIRAIAFDRYNFRFLRQSLVDEGFTEDMLEKFQEFGQGFASMSPALREFETLLLNGKIRHGGNPILTMCAANCRTETDPAGNRKLSKRRSSGRIDGMVALAMALSVATSEIREEQYGSIWEIPDLYSTEQAA